MLQKVYNYVAGLWDRFVSLRSSVAVLKMSSQFGKSYGERLMKEIAGHSKNTRPIYNAHPTINATSPAQAGMLATH